MILKFKQFQVGVEVDRFEFFFDYSSFLKYRFTPCQVKICCGYVVLRLS